MERPALARDRSPAGQSPRQGWGRRGVLLVTPSLEAGLDRDGLYRVDYECMARAIAASGYAVRSVDPRDPHRLVASLADPDFPLILTVRSQSKDWAMPPPGSSAFQAASAKTLITLVGNPPFYAGSFGFHEARFRHKLAMCADHDSLDYAESINRSGSILLPYRPAYHDAGLEDEATWLPASRRPTAILFVGTYDDPDEYRSSWRRLFARFPNVVASIEAAAETLASSLGTPVVRVLERAMTDLGHRFDLRSRAGRLALELLARFASNQARQRLLTRLVRYPSTIVTTRPELMPDPHPACSLQRPVAFERFLGMMKQARCIVTLNPNFMTGAISERVSNAMRRGALVLSAPNSALARFDGTAAVTLGPALEGLEDWLEASLAGDPALDGYGAAASEIARTRFGMKEAFAAMLDFASTLRPDDARPDDARPDDARPDDARPDDARPDDTRPDDARSGKSRPARLHGER